MADSVDRFGFELIPLSHGGQYGPHPLWVAFHWVFGYAISPGFWVVRRTMGTCRSVYARGIGVAPRSLAPANSATSGTAHTPRPPRPHPLTRACTSYTPSHEKCGTSLATLAYPTRLGSISLLVPPTPAPGCSPSARNEVDTIALPLQVAWL